VDDRLIKLSKLADYGIVIMTHLARPAGGQSSAQSIARATRIPQPTTSKILKALARDGLLRSQRGVNGGYELSRAAGSITIAQIIVALDGPIAVTDCVDGAVGSCVIERLCPARTNWERINAAIRDALDGVTLAEMASGVPAAFGGLPERPTVGGSTGGSLALGG
jgi:FeS assembly SUF system regulator